MSEEMIEKSPLALRLEKRMLEVGFPTKGRLSSASGVSRAILTNIMRRPEKEIWASVAVKLAKTLECRVEWLLDGAGPVVDGTAENHDMVYGHAPKLNLNDLAVEDLERLVLEEFKHSEDKTLHCPIVSGKLTVAVKAERKLGKFDEEDYIFVDLEKRSPRSGQVVLARKRGSAGVPEFYNYTSALDKAYLRSLTDDLPEELRLIEMTEAIEVIGCVVASTKIF